MEQQECILKREIFIIISDLFDDYGNVLSYKVFMNTHTAIQIILLHSKCCSFQSHYAYNNKNSFPDLRIRSKQLDSACSHVYIRNTFISQDYTHSKGVSFWNGSLKNVNWHLTWTLLFKYCINNKVRETGS